MTILWSHGFEKTGSSYASKISQVKLRKNERNERIWKNKIWKIENYKKKTGHLMKVLDLSRNNAKKDHGHLRQGLTVNKSTQYWNMQRKKNLTSLKFIEIIRRKYSDTYFIFLNIIANLQTCSVHVKQIFSPLWWTRKKKRPRSPLHLPNKKLLKNTNRFNRNVYINKNNKSISWTH